MTCKKQGNCLSEPLFFVEKYSRQQLIWRLYFFISFIIFLYVGCFASESLPVVVEWHEYECQQGVPAENLHCARHSVSFAGHRQNGQIPCTGVSDQPCRQEQLRAGPFRHDLLRAGHPVRGLPLQLRWLQGAGAARMGAGDRKGGLQVPQHLPRQRPGAHRHFGGACRKAAERCGNILLI